MPRITLKVHEHMDILLRRRAHLARQSLNHFILQCVEKGLLAMGESASEEGTPQKEAVPAYLQKIKLKIAIETLFLIQYLVELKDKNIALERANQAKQVMKALYEEAKQERG